MSDELPVHKALVDAVSATLQWLKEGGIASALVGGVAASTLARSRYTADVDWLIQADDDGIKRLLNLASRHQLEPRTVDPAREAMENYQLRLVHTPTNVPVDLLLATIPFEKEAVSSANLLEIAGHRVPFARPEYLILMKLIAYRPRDRADIEALLECSAGLDRDALKALVAEVARQTDLPELVERLNEFLAPRSSG